MRDKISPYLFPVLIAVLIALICIYGIERNKNHIDAVNTQPVTLNNTQEDYIEKNPDVTIYIDEGLRYLSGKDSADGFLEEYLREILADTGLAVQLTEDENADCRLMIITDEIRQSNQGNRYTSPLFQMDGAFFLHEEADERNTLSGIVMSERMTDSELAEFRYHDIAPKFSGTHSAAAAVEEARTKNKDFIIGDRSAVLFALGGETDYIPAEDSIYSMNVCLVTDREDDILHGILNECIHNTDRHVLTYELGEKWMDGDGPVYMKDSYEDVYLLILIVIAAVIIVFFIYYQANKNLYRELNDRMVQLTESKQELKTTFNGVGYYLAELDLDGGITDINRAFYNFVNTDTAGRKIWDVIDMEQSHQRSLQELVQQASKGEQADSIEVLLKKQTMVLKIFPIENARGAVEKLLFMGMDVTRERMAERQLLQDNKMIAIGQLAAGVAHEIRNPLGIIRNYCYVLKNMEDEKVRAKAVEQIEKAVENSGAIINNLLDFSRISSHGGERIDVESHMKSLVILNKNILKKKQISLEIICEERVEAFLSAQSLDMVLINLISNAIDAMQENGNLTIKVVKWDETFEIEVQDTGCGIEKTVLEEIFNPFFTTKGSNGGTGLGLYIVYNEIKKMNGEISVDSVLGEGTKFKLILPLNDGDDAGEKKDDERKSENTGGR